MQYCQPAPDTLPDPESCLLTGILPQACLQRTACPNTRGGCLRSAIEAELGAPGHHRRGLQQHPLRRRGHAAPVLALPDGPVRPRMGQNGCSRWDLLDTVRCTWALRPEGIDWPVHDDGRPSFKLEHLTAANDLVHEAAHDALSDVRATIALARLVKNASRGCGTSA
jgi:exodeoxyribonuclease-1